MSVHAYKIDDDKEVMVIHRNFDGTHDDNEDCWCRPEVIPTDSSESAEEIVARLEECNG